MSMYIITVIEGDGIGREVIPERIRDLDAVIEALNAMP